MNPCNCDGEYIDGRVVAHTAGCPLHGMCEFCLERLGVGWFTERLESGKPKRFWVCGECAKDPA